MDYHSLQAEAAIERSRIVMPGSANNLVVKATGPTAPLIGTVDVNIDHTAGEMVDIELRPIGTVKLGGAVAFMDPITSDANGKGVKAVPAAGANVRIIGYAARSGVDGDEIRYFRSLSTLQG